MTESPEEGRIEAVPTEYGGTTFRSRLEADWAQTLNGARIKWRYEPETITLPSRAVYIPDFWLPEIGVWLEVKGPNVPRIEKAAELARARTCCCERECTCRWPGGELVIAGRQSFPSDGLETGRRPPAGYVAWDTPVGPSAYYMTCPSCDRAQWITMRRPWRCRACRAVVEGRTVLYRSADRPLRFVEGLPTGWKPPHMYAPRDVEEDQESAPAGPDDWG
ncbi:hypothetical protein ACFW1M_26745 [Streptomyces inhibens]|uniref:hypothetical protein n=1 Tax=Streptomyces inhibens TaxID=2293571 RepID=UPI003685B767